MDDLLREFLTETSESLDLVDVELVRFEREPNNTAILGHLFRLVHTIKGTCGFLGLSRLEALTHAAETVLGQFRDGAPVSGEAVTLVLLTIDRIKRVLVELERHQREPDGSDDDLIRSLAAMAEFKRAFRDALSLVPDVELGKLKPARAPIPTEAEEDQDEGGVARDSIRIRVDALDHLMDMVSELVLTRNQLLDIMRRHGDTEFSVPLQRLSSVTAELQDAVMKTRMQPIGHAWRKLPRIVRDLSAELGKDIALEMHGAETELDRQVLERIKDPLTHMVRNAVDHGLETPPERVAAGKPETGTIRLSARHESGHVIIGIADDGRGLGTARIRSKALEAGLAKAAELARMPDKLVQRFIFAPGFSTAARVTSVSGRGVGMDVVRSNLDQIGGSIDVNSVDGRGVSFTVKIPLTLAIVSALIVEAAGERFAIPQFAVAKLVHMHADSEHRVERIRDAVMLRMRDKLLPLANLGSLLRLVEDSELPRHGYVVVAQAEGRQFGVMVDAVLHTEEIVVKPMATKLRHIGMFCGTTILGDGSVIMILDPEGIAWAAGVAEGPDDRADIEAASTPIAAADTVFLLMVRAGSPELKAVPLSLVARLEEIDGRTIEHSNGRLAVPYRGQLMPLVWVDGEVRIKDDAPQPLLVIADGGRSTGLVVDEIVDIAEATLAIEVGSSRPGVLGSALVAGRATEVLDVGHFLPLADAARVGTAA